jgi:ADP-ribose pyrophosphatase
VQNPWFEVRQDNIVLPNGEQTVYNVLHKANAVWVVPVLEDGRVVLINQYRHPIGEWCLEIPAGGIPADQTPEEVAKQELQEEVGGAAAEWHFLGKYWTMNGIGDELGYFFLATGVTLSASHHEATEIIELQIVPAAQALEMARSGQILDAPSALALLLCQDRLSL